jgi:hypothetical protein
VIVTALRIGEPMISFFALKSVCGPLAREAKWAGLVAGVAIAVCASGPIFVQAAEKIPDLGSSSGFAWTPLTINGGIARYGTGWFDPPAGLRGPIKQDPDYVTGGPPPPMCQVA